MTNNYLLNCCPICNNKLATDNAFVYCKECNREYEKIDEYFDFYVEDNKIVKVSYPNKLKHLYFNEKIILSIKPLSYFSFKGFFSSRLRFNKMLKKLKNTISNAGASERSRVEFMVDDRNTTEFVSQEIFTQEKANRISNIIQNFGLTGGEVLHIGCGGYVNRAIPKMYIQHGFINYGIDVVRSYVKEFLLYGKASMANATAIPFPDRTFDVINFTDILEHLFDPLSSLMEASRVLKTGGIIIITTPARGIIKLWNPSALLRLFMEKIFPILKKPRIITGEWDNEVFFHTEFTPSELKELLVYSNFRVRSVGTIEFKWSAKSFKQQIMGLFKSVVKGNNNNTYEWIVVAQKK